MGAKDSFIKSLNLILLNQYGNNITAMANAMGIHRNQLNRYISGATSPTLETVDELSRILGISFLELLAPDSINASQASSPAAQGEIDERLKEMEEMMAKMQVLADSLENKKKSS